MNVNALPVGTNPLPLDCSHFPTKMQAVIWRNWELVSAKSLAKVLKTSETNILCLAKDMGLRVPPGVTKEWLTRGYITIIRANWHLLPYEQLLELLGWDAKQMEDTLRDEDFLWVKLGNLKPNAKPVYYTQLTEEEVRRTKEIKQIVEKYFPNTEKDTTEKPFDFLLSFKKPYHISEKSKINKINFDIRLIYSCCASTGDLLLHMDKSDPYPEGLLARYAELGINAIWIGVILYQLYPFPPAQDLSDGYEKRLANLQKLAKRAAKYGIGVYLYLNEPRGLPLRYYDKFPDIKGVERRDRGVAAMCSSQKEVQDYLEKSSEWVFRHVPELAGAFTINMSENVTNCFAQWHGVECSRCSQRTPAQVIAEINIIIERGMRTAKPDAKLIMWTWCCDKPWVNTLMDLLPETIDIMSVSEEELPTNIGGVPGIVYDYSMSQVGPGTTASKIWNYARSKGHKTFAKVQLNSCWESSFVPYIPVLHTVRKHLNNLTLSAVDSLMIAWTVGGFPSMNLELLSNSAEEVILNNFGRKAFADINEAVKKFSNAFEKHFPFHFESVRRFNFAANLLYLTPTGYTATMLGFYYDDLESWRKIYPADVFENLMSLLILEWKEGLDFLKKAECKIEKDRLNNLGELKNIALVCYCHFKTTYLQARFIRLRSSITSETRDELYSILEEERELAVILYESMGKDSRIAYEASNHYYYTLNDLKEKVINCEYIHDCLK